MTTTLSNIIFDPLLPWSILAGFGIVAVLLALLGWRARARGLAMRLATVAVLLLTLANPSLVEEERKPVADTALIVIDDSESQGIGDRRLQVANARAALARKLSTIEGLEVREVTLPPANLALGSERPGGTRLIEAMRGALSEIPRERLAGVIMITDGQVHDVPAALPAELGSAPLHTLLTGKRDEADRLLVIEQAPRFGVVGRDVTMRFRVEDSAQRSGTASVSVSINGEIKRRLEAPIGRSIELPLTVGNPGANVVEVEVAPGQRELSLDNNRGLFVISGVRDRLRVLLVSGEPYQGERAWRNLLKSDPGVDLVHFTILRTPSKDDFTQTRELSLIVFPMRELFEQKLKEFDLIIFDRYESGNLITREYFRNIAEYVRGGGALLIAVGPIYATPRSLHKTPLGAVLPAAPSGEVIERGFRPTVTDIGFRHPVTAELPQSGAPGQEPTWGRWFRQVVAKADRGQTLMAGADNRPLLVLDKVENGRIGIVLSDHLWLWNRGLEAGGPQPELVRRIAHWLMKEPELEEEAMRATSVGGRIEITRRTLAENFKPITMTAPDGQQRKLDPQQVAPGRGVATVIVEKPGVYRFDDGELKTVAAVGSPNPMEFADLRATESKLRPLVDASGGGMLWLSDVPDPDIRAVRAGRSMAGSDWLGLRRNESYTVTGIKTWPMLPGLVVALLFLLAIGAAWYREGR